MEKIATYEELGQFWSLEDVDKACAVLDIKAAITDALSPEPPKGN